MKKKDLRKLASNATDELIIMGELIIDIFVTKVFEADKRV